MRRSGARRARSRDHGADPEKVEVAPFGANMRITHTREDVVAAVAHRPPESCRLLFVGVDWYRKGGDRALESATILNDWGLPTGLT